MSLSNSYPLGQTRNDIITLAYRKVGVIDETETANTNQINVGASLLNMITTDWHNAGLPTWYMKTGYVFPKLGNPTATSTIAVKPTQASQVLLGSTGDAAGYSYIYTYATQAGTPAGSPTSIYIPADDATSADQEGNVPDSTWLAVIQLDDGTTQFTNISGIIQIDANNYDLQLPSGLRDDVSENNIIYLFPYRIVRPLKVVEAWKRIMPAETDVILRNVERDTYLGYANKYSRASPTAVYYHDTLTNGTLHMYPQMFSINELIVIDFQHPFDLFLASADNPSVPDEFAMAFMWSLAAELASNYGLPLDERSFLYQVAREKVLTAFSFNHEEGSIFITADGRHTKGN